MSGRRRAGPRRRKSAPSGKRRSPARAPPDFLDFASFLEAPKLAPEASPGPARSEDDWLTAVSPFSRRFRRTRRIRRLGYRRRCGRRSSSHRLARPSPREPEPDSAAALDILDRIARAAGVPPGAFSSRDPDELADEIGAVLRMMAENLGQMLASRAESKTLMRSVEPHDDPTCREQSAQIREFPGGGARHHVRAAHAKLSRRADDDRA